MATQSVTGPDSNGAIRRMIQNTIDRLQKSSIRTDDLGSRYARMLRLLWRKPPHSKDAAQDPPSRQSRTPPPIAEQTQSDDRPLPPPLQQSERTMSIPGGDQVSLGAFSWRDLDAVGQYASTNLDGMSVLSGSGSALGTEVEDPFGGYLENQGQTWFDFGLSPNNVIF